MSVDAFVSCATPDRAITMALVEDLESRGLKCWVAPRDVPGGSKYAEVILNALAESKVFLLVFSENSNNSEHVQREVERALNSSKSIVPVRIADIFPSGAMDYYLATLHWIDAFGDSRAGSFDIVASAMGGVLGRELIDPDEAVGADAVPVLAGAGASAENLSMAASAAVPTPTAAPARDAASKSTSAKSGSGRGGMIAVAVAVVLAVGGLVAWKAVDWGGSDDGDGQDAAGGDAGKGGQASTVSSQTADAAKAVDVNDGANSTSSADTNEPDKTTKSGATAVPVAGIGADPKVGAGAAPKSGDPRPAGNGGGDKAGIAGEPIGKTVGEGKGSSEVTERVDPSVANANVNLAGRNPDMVVAGGELPAAEKSDVDDAAKKMSAEPTPPDPVAVAMAAAQKAWQSGERKLARDSWLGLLQSPAGKDLKVSKLGEDGVKLLSEMVVAASKDADGEGDNAAAAAAFSELEEWKEVVDFSEQLGLDELAAERERFQIGWQMARAESMWASGSREEVAKSLTAIAGLGAPVLDRMKTEGDFVGSRLAGLLNEVTKAAAGGRLGTSQALTEQWRPSWQLAAESGDVTAKGVLATMAWKSGDRERTAELLKEYEVATRSSESLDQGVASLLGQALAIAQAEMVATAAGKGDGTESSLLTAAWEPAFNIASRHELRGALEVVAEVTHRRDPGEAVALYRRLYDRATEGGSLRKRIAFCLQM